MVTRNRIRKKRKGHIEMNIDLIEVETGVFSCDEVKVSNYSEWLNNLKGL